MSALGHNGGPALAGGTGWQLHCWSQARKDLLPTLPIEVVRLRVKRAAELGLQYRTYASIRATSGHDVIALLFSTNALHMVAPRPALSDARRARLMAIRATGLGALVNPPLTPDTVHHLVPALFDLAAPAPQPFAVWAEARKTVLDALRPKGWPTDRVVMIGDTTAERDWSQAARMAWHLTSDQFFGAPTPA